MHCNQTNVHGLHRAKENLEVFLEKVPEGMSLDNIRERIINIPGVKDIHEIHLWSLNGSDCCATMHVVAEGALSEIKKRTKQELSELGIRHIALEFETEDEKVLA